MKDINNTVIKIGQTVLVPDPNNDDIHNHSFVGTVEQFRGEYVTVIDGEGDCFDIEPERLEIQDDDYGIPTFYVDIPKVKGDGNPSEEWYNVESFSTKEDALKYAQEHFGADEKGMVCLISNS